MATRALQVLITGDASDLNRAFKSIDDDVKKSEGRMKKFGGVAATALKGVGIAAAAGAALGLKQAADAAIEAEKSQARLSAQLKAVNSSYKVHGEEIDRVIQKTSRLAGLDDEDLQDAFTAIVRSTGNVSEGFRNVGLAADIARARNMDVAKAGELVGKVAGGNVGILGRYGIKFDEVTTAQDKLAKKTGEVTDAQRRSAEQQDKFATKTEALALLQQRFGGQAEAYGKTTAGSVDRMKVAWENLMELLGAKLAPVITKVADVITDLMDKNSKSGGIVRKVIDAYKDYLRWLVHVFSTVRDAVIQWVNKNRESLDNIRRAFKNVAEFIRDIIRDVVIPVVERVWPVVRDVFKKVGAAIGDAVELVSSLINGRWKDAWEQFKSILRNVRDAVNRLMGAIGKLIVSGLKEIPGLVKTAAEAIGRGIWAGIKAGLKGAINDDGGFGDVVRGFLGPAGSLFNAGKNIGNPFGDGIGKSFAAAGFGGGSGVAGGLMGANPALRPFATIGSRFGLSVSSGKFGRENKLTSTGNVSYHSSGEALDILGSGPAMLAYFNYLKKHFGSRLAELIHTPGGAGIKDGRPYTYTGITAAQHYDHVHVALDLGRPGPGIGDGPGKGGILKGLNHTFPRHGLSNAAGHTQLSQRQVRAIAESAGFSPGVALQMAQIARGESTFYPGIVSFDQGYGLWQMTPRVWGAEAKAQMNRLGGLGAMLNPFKNAQMAKWLYDQAGDFSPWYGTRYLDTGMDTSSVKSVLGSKGGLPGAGGGGGGATKAPAMGVVGGKGGSIWGIPGVGGGGGTARGKVKPGKSGLGALGAPADWRENLPSGTDYIDAMIAEAALTPGDADDKAAVGKLVDYWSKALVRARASGDPRRVTEAATGLKSAQDAMAQLTASIDALKAEVIALKRQEAENWKLRYEVSQSQYQVIARAIADVSNSELGGRAGLFSETPSFAGRLASS